LNVEKTALRALRVSRKVEGALSDLSDRIAALETAVASLQTAARGEPAAQC